MAAQGKAIKGSDRAVVKLSNNGFKHELSIYLDDAGMIEGRYFDSNGKSKQVFSGYMTEDGIEIYEASPGERDLV